MPDAARHSRASDKAWDLAVKIAAGLTIAVSIWAANAERRLSQSEREAARAVVMVETQDTRVRQLEREQVRAEEQRANISGLLGEIRGDIKELLERQR